MTARSLRGCGTALVTPFARDGAVDEKALRALVDWQIAEGIHFLVPCGTTGEAVTLSPEERLEVVRTVVGVAKGRVKVIAGATSNDTRVATAEARRMADAGAEAALAPITFNERISTEYSWPLVSPAMVRRLAVAGAPNHGPASRRYS